MFRKKCLVVLIGLFGCVSAGHGAVGCEPCPGYQHCETTTSGISYSWNSPYGSFSGPTNQQATFYICNHTPRFQLVTVTVQTSPGQFSAEPKNVDCGTLV